MGCTKQEIYQIISWKSSNLFYNKTVLWCIQLIMKIKNLIFLLGLACIALSGCSPTLPVVIDEEIDYSQ